MLDTAQRAFFRPATCAGPFLPWPLLSIELQLPTYRLCDRPQSNSGFLQFPRAIQWARWSSGDASTK